MTVFVVLQNWKDYDFRKQRLGMDPRYFDGSQNWEVEFLVKKIHQLYDFIGESHIREAIQTACSKEKKSLERKPFVHDVLELLAIPA